MILKPKTMVDKAVEFLQEKKAKDINVINIEKITIIADYFVICSGSSTTNIKAIADEVEFRMSEIGYSLLHKEGYETARWILLDYGSVVVHIFHEEERSFYNLERLWNDGIFTMVDNR